MNIPKIITGIVITVASAVFAGAFGGDAATVGGFVTVGVSIGAGIAGLFIKSK